MITETLSGLLALLAFFLMPFIILHWTGSSGEPTWVERLAHRSTTRLHRAHQRTTPALRTLSTIIASQR